MSDAIETLWTRATADTPTRSVSANRHRDGNYVTGYRDDTDTWVSQVGVYVVIATQVEWQTFNLAADSEGTRRRLEVKLDERVIFAAREEGASTRTYFSGADERYRGAQHTAAQSWQVIMGEIPVEVAPEGHP